MCWEALASSPAIMLSCGHACHLACAKEQLKQVASCPVSASKAEMLCSHPSLRAEFEILDLPCLSWYSISWDIHIQV